MKCWDKLVYIIVSGEVGAWGEHALGQNEALNKTITN